MSALYMVMILGGQTTAIYGLYPHGILLVHVRRGNEITACLCPFQSFISIIIYVVRVNLYATYDISSHDNTTKAVPMGEKHMVVISDAAYGGRTA